MRRCGCAALRNLMRGLSTIAGRKTVMLVSGGMLSSTRVGGRPDVTTLMGQGRVGGRGGRRQPLRAALGQHCSSTSTRPPTSRRAGRQDRVRVALRGSSRDRARAWKSSPARPAARCCASRPAPAKARSTACSAKRRRTTCSASSPTSDDRDGKAHFLRVSVKPRGDHGARAHAGRRPAARDGSTPDRRRTAAAGAGGPRRAVLASIAGRRGRRRRRRRSSARPWMWSASTSRWSAVTATR